MLSLRRCTTLTFLLTRLLRGATDWKRRRSRRTSISTHTPLARRDINSLPSLRLGLQFLLTRLLRGATSGLTNVLRKCIISTHTPLARRDFTFSICYTGVVHFYSHASCEARRHDSYVTEPTNTFLLTRLLRGATKKLVRYIIRNSISTHTPLARRDRPFFQIELSQSDFYSHASCEARHGVINQKSTLVNFYSHASCEARL